MEENIELAKRSRAPSATLPIASSDWSEGAMAQEPQFRPGSSVRGEKAAPMGFNDMTVQERRNFLVLVMLYLLQGIPVGLAFGSIPFLLKTKLSYGQVGIFTLASYPYSLKVLWSPIVDAVYSRSFGRRKSWIIPIQALSSVVLMSLGSIIQPYMEDAEHNLGKITIFFLVLVFLCATQDIAVDGWGLTLLSGRALPFASTAQTIGLNTGYFMSFTVFLALNSPEFANKYFRSTPSSESAFGLVSLEGYLRFWGIVYAIMTVLVGLFKREDRVRSDDGSILSVYKTMWNVLNLKHIQTLILVHCVAKVGFQANEAVTNLKLLEKGLSKEDLALTVLIDFPFEIIFGYYAAKWSTGKNPLQPWLQAFLGRLVFAVLSMFVVMMFPKSGAGPGYLFVVILVHVLGNFMSTIQFVSINAFHTQIADPLIGGTYMTILNTISNLGGQWPRLIVLAGVDWFTVATCSVDGTSCAVEPGKSHCKALGGTCSVSQDGYYVMNIVCICFGLGLFYSFIKPKMYALQHLAISQWRVD